MGSYVPKFRHLVKILFRVRDPQAAEGLFYEGTWLAEQELDKEAHLAFAHARLRDPDFGGAFYNYAALTEKMEGNSPKTIRAWEEYVAVASRDARQDRETVAKVEKHVAELKNANP